MTATDDGLTFGFAETGHHPSATRHLRVTSMLNMFSVWYTAFSRLTCTARLTVSLQDAAQPGDQIKSLTPSNSSLPVLHLQSSLILHRSMLQSSQVPHHHSPLVKIVADVVENVVPVMDTSIQRVL